MKTRPKQLLGYLQLDIALPSVNICHCQCTHKALRAANHLSKLIFGCSPQTVCASHINDFDVINFFFVVVDIDVSFKMRRVWRRGNDVDADASALPTNFRRKRRRPAVNVRKRFLLVNFEVAK